MAIFTNKITPIRSPFSPIVADLVMRDLEAKETRCYQSLFYYYYVDDIVMAVSKNLIDFTLETS